jgi:hypothetical protein
MQIEVNKNPVQAGAQGFLASTADPRRVRGEQVFTVDVFLLAVAERAMLIVCSAYPLISLYR